MAYNNSLDLKSLLILRKKLHVIVDLVAKAIITLPKIILNSKYLPCILTVFYSTGIWQIIVYAVC